MSSALKILVTIGSIISIAFGIWHFYVPKAWNWISYIDSSATELVVAVTTINVFFSLSLILFGLVNILLVHGNGVDKYSMLVILSAACILWLCRVVMQLVYPQGSINAVLQYGMLSIFIFVFLCYCTALILLQMSQDGG